MDNTTFSLLYTSNELMEKSSSLQESVTCFRYNPEMITDLQLDELCSFLFDVENFSQPEEFLKILCTNVRDILYRQQIINDLTQNPNLLKSFHTISKELKSLTELKTLYENRKEAWIKYDLLYRLLIKYVECVSLLIESLKLADINSEGLTACRNWIEIKYEKENITQLKLNLAQVKNDYKQVKGLIAGINVNEYCEPKCLTIEKIIYEEFTLSGIPLAETPKNHIIQDDLPVSDTRQHLGLSSINSMTKFGSNVNGQLLSLYLNKKLQKILKDQTNMIKNSLSQYENIDFSNLIDQYNALIFYYTAVRWYNLLSSKSLKSTQPKVCDREFKFCAEGCYSPIFVLRMNPEDISSNDVNLHKMSM